MVGGGSSEPLEFLARSARDPHPATTLRVVAVLPLKEGGVRSIESGAPQQRQALARARRCSSRRTFSTTALAASFEVNISSVSSSSSTTGVKAWST